MTNILLICTDQHRADMVGCYGNADVSTPAIDRLAAEGTLFERCYVPNPICAPTRAGILTGKFPNAHGLWANGVELPPGNPLLGRVLADAGYDTGLAGRLHLSACGGDRTERRLDDGFRFFEWANSPGHRSPDSGYHRWVRENFPDLWREEVARDAATAPAPRGGREVVGLCEDMPVEAHFSRWVSEKSIEFLREQSPQRPFFLIANFYEPHHPFFAPKEYRDRYAQRPVRSPIRPNEPGDGKPGLQDRLSAGAAMYNAGFAALSEAEIQDMIAAYYAMVSHVDDEIGRIITALDELGLTEDTLVIFTADHGEMLGDHGQLLKGPMFYEGAVRVPLILRLPGRVPAGERCDGLVQSPDIFGTALSAAGLAAPASNVDLVGMARGESDGRPWALTVYRNSGFPMDPPVHATMLREERYKLVVYHGDGDEGELYDLERDPQELTNLWPDPDHAGVRLRLMGLLLNALVATEDRTAPREAAF